MHCHAKLHSASPIAIRKIFAQRKGEKELSTKRLFFLLTTTMCAAKREPDEALKEKKE